MRKKSVGNEWVKGQSSIIVLILILLIIIVSMIIVFSIVIPVVKQNSNKIEKQAEKLTLSYLTAENLQKYSGSANITIKAGMGQGVIKKIRIIFSTSSGTNCIIDKDILIRAFEVKTINVDTTSCNGEIIDVLGIDPIDWEITPSGEGEGGETAEITQCGEIDIPGTYTLTQDITSEGTCITITSDDVVLDGNGHSLVWNSANSGGYGIYMNDNRKNIVIKNINFNNSQLTFGFVPAVYTEFNLTDSLITENNFSDKAYWPSTLVFINWIVRTNISNNNFDVYQAKTIGSRYSLQSVIKNNNFMCRTSASEGVRYYEFPLSTHTRDVIDGNSFSGCWNTIAIANTDSEVIKNNRISGNGFGAILFMSNEKSDYISNNTINGGTDIIFWNGAIPLNLTLVDQKIETYTIPAAGNITFVNSGYGSIFLNSISGTGTNLFGLNTSDIRISVQTAYINPAKNWASSSNPATISLEIPVNLVNLSILKDNVACTSDICSTPIVEKLGTVKFSVKAGGEYNVIGDAGRFYGGIYGVTDCFNISANPIPICTCDDLQNMSLKLDGNYEVQNNVDCSDTRNWNDGQGFEPIGPWVDNYFTGNFDGKSNIISDLYIYRPTNDYQGLFGYSRGNILNVGITNVNITGKLYLGALVGFIENVNIFSVYSTGNVKGTARVGGLIGDSQGYNYISNVFSNVNVYASSTRAGGIIGRFSESSSIINNSFSTGKVFAGNYMVGGITGYLNNAKIYNCFSTANIQAPSTKGGLVGINAGEIYNSYWYDKKNGLNCYNGGNTGCTAVNTTEYFYNINNPPMDKWDFVNIWSDYNDGEDYPTLKKVIYLENCIPDCTNRACGGDGCGGSCGVCGVNQICSEEDICITMNRTLAYYSFEAGANDLSENNNDGFVFNATTETGNFGNFYKFDGKSSYISIEDNETLKPDKISVSIWINTASYNDYDSPLLKSKSISMNDGYGFYYLDGRINFFVSDKVNSVSINAKKNEWVNYIGTYDGNELKLYENTVLVDTMPVSGKIKNNVSQLMIGKALLSVNQYYFNGSIDEVRIWNYALSEKEIKRQQKKSAVAYWKLNEIIQNKFIDITGEHNGSISGNVAIVNDVTRGNVTRFNNGGFFVQNSKVLTDPFTVNVWVRARNSSDEQIIVSANEGADKVLSIKDSTFSALSVCNSIPQTPYEWHYVSVTYDGERVGLLVDGIEECSFSTTLGGIEITNFGYAPVSGNKKYFIGDMSSAEIWDGVLSDEDIHRLYLESSCNLECSNKKCGMNECGGQCTNQCNDDQMCIDNEGICITPDNSLLLYYPFTVKEEPSELLTDDYSGNSNDGYLKNLSANSIPLWTPKGYLRGAYSFNLGYIDSEKPVLGNGLNSVLNRTGSFEAWIKVANNSLNNSAILSQSEYDKGYNLVLDVENIGGNKSYYLSCHDNNAANGTKTEEYEIVPEEWYHAACIYDAYTVSLYLDGEYVASARASGIDTGCYKTSINPWCNYADVNQDGSVTTEDYDLIDLFAQTDNLTCDYVNDYCNNTDINLDGITNESDIQIWAENNGMTNCVVDYTVLNSSSVVDNCKPGLETSFKVGWEMGLNSFSGMIDEVKVRKIKLVADKPDITEIQEEIFNDASLGRCDNNTQIEDPISGECYDNPYGNTTKITAAFVMDENGNLVDALGRTRAVLSGDARVTDDPDDPNVEKVIQLSGAGSIDFPDGIPLGDSFSISMPFKIDSLPANNAALFEDEVFARFNSAGNLEIIDIGSKNVLWTSTNPLPEHQYTMITITKGEGGDINVYLNGGKIGGPIPYLFDTGNLNTLTKIGEGGNMKIVNIQIMSGVMDDYQANKHYQDWLEKYKNLCGTGTKKDYCGMCRFTECNINNANHGNDDCHYDAEKPLCQNFPNDVNGYCVQCLSDLDCESGLKCSRGECVNAIVPSCNTCLRLAQMYQLHVQGITNGKQGGLGEGNCNQCSKLNGDYMLVLPSLTELSASPEPFYQTSSKFLVRNELECSSKNPGSEQFWETAGWAFSLQGTPGSYDCHGFVSFSGVPTTSCMGPVHPCFTSEASLSNKPSYKYPVWNFLTERHLGEGSSLTYDCRYINADNPPFKIEGEWETQFVGEVGEFTIKGCQDGTDCPKCSCFECKESFPPVGCKDPEHYKCDNNKCVPKCIIDEDCPGNQRCMNLQCAPGECVEGAITIGKRGCKNGWSCVHGRCIPECKYDSDCKNKGPLVLVGKAGSGFSFFFREDGICKTGKCEVIEKLDKTACQNTDWSFKDPSSESNILPQRILDIDNSKSGGLVTADPSDSSKKPVTEDPNKAFIGGLPKCDVFRGFAGYEYCFCASGQVMDENGNCVCKNGEQLSGKPGQTDRTCIKNCQKKQCDGFDCCKKPVFSPSSVESVESGQEIKECGCNPCTGEINECKNKYICQEEADGTQNLYVEAGYCTIDSKCKKGKRVLYEKGGPCRKCMTGDICTDTSFKKDKNNLPYKEFYGNNPPAWNNLPEDTSCFFSNEKVFAEKCRLNRNEPGCQYITGSKYVCKSGRCEARDTENTEKNNIKTPADSEEYIWPNLNIFKPDDLINNFLMLAVIYVEAEIKADSMDGDLNYTKWIEQLKILKENYEQELKATNDAVLKKLYARALVKISGDLAVLYEARQENTINKRGGNYFTVPYSTHNTGRSGNIAETFRFEFKTKLENGIEIPKQVRFQLKAITNFPNPCDFVDIDKFNLDTFIIQDCFKSIFPIIDSLDKVRILEQWDSYLQLLSQYKYNINALGNEIDPDYGYSMLDGINLDDFNLAEEQLDYIINDGDNNNFLGMMDADWNSYWSSYISALNNKAGIEIIRGNYANALLRLDTAVKDTEASNAYLAQAKLKILISSIDPKAEHKGGDLIAQALQDFKTSVEKDSGNKLAKLEREQIIEMIYYQIQQQLTQQNQEELDRVISEIGLSRIVNWGASNDYLNKEYETNLDTVDAIKYGLYHLFIIKRGTGDLTAAVSGSGMELKEFLTKSVKEQYKIISGIKGYYINDLIDNTDLTKDQCISKNEDLNHLREVANIQKSIAIAVCIPDIALLAGDGKESSAADIMAAYGCPNRNQIKNYFKYPSSEGYKHKSVLDSKWTRYVTSQVNLVNGIMMTTFWMGSVISGMRATQGVIAALEANTARTSETVGIEIINTIGAEQTAEISATSALNTITWRVGTGVAQRSFSAAALGYSWTGIKIIGEAVLFTGEAMAVSAVSEPVLATAVSPETAKDISEILSLIIPVGFHGIVGSFTTGGITSKLQPFEVIKVSADGKTYEPMMFFSRRAMTPEEFASANSGEYRFDSVSKILYKKVQGVEKPINWFDQAQLEAGGIFNPGETFMLPRELKIVIDTVANLKKTKPAGVGGCFLAGTQIQLADGSYKCIEDIKEGDMVNAFDTANNKPASAAVTTTFVRPDNNYLQVEYQIFETGEKPVFGDSVENNKPELSASEELKNAVRANDIGNNVFG